MKLKQKIANAFVNYTHGWNQAMHYAIERKIIEGFNDMFPNGLRNPDETDAYIEKARTFYYQRMVNTATIILTGISILVALLAILVALIAIHFS